jgi:hypothetical protein
MAADSLPVPARVFRSRSAPRWYLPVGLATEAGQAWVAAKETFAEACWPAGVSLFATFVASAGH